MSLLLDEIDREESPAKRRHDLQLCNPGVLTWWEEPSGLHLARKAQPRKQMQINLILLPQTIGTGGWEGL